MRIAQRYHVPCEQRERELDDAELVERVLEGDSEAFETLICRYGQPLYRLARGIVENDSDAQDVLQKAFIKIHRKLETLRTPSSFSSWAYRIVRNMALMEVRSRKRDDEIGFGDLGPGRDDERHFETDAPDWRHRGEDVAETLELRGQLAEAIEQLEPKYQSPFVLYELEGCEMEEIADALDLSIAGVKTRLHRARLRLRATLERYLRDDLEVWS